MLVFLKLALFNLSEAELLNKTEEMERSSIDMLSDLNSSMVASQDLIANLLLGALQMAISELHENLNNYRPINSDFIVYLISHFNLSLAFIFQSGFYPKITNSATNLIRLNSQSVNQVDFDFALLNDLFLKVAYFCPNLTISWLNLLYILNYQHLPQICSKLIEHSTCDKPQLRQPFVGIRFSLIKRVIMSLLVVSYN